MSEIVHSEWSHEGEDDLSIPNLGISLYLPFYIFDP